MAGSVLYDAPGPRARRRALIGSVVAIAVAAFLLVIVLRRFADKGQLDADRWEFVTDPAILRFLGGGLLNTLKAAAAGGALALAIGLVMAVGRLAPSVLVRAVATSYVQFFRAVPLILLILFMGLGLPSLGLKLPVFWFLVFGLALYNGAVFAEIFRSGILALPRGQREAGASLGLTFWQTMRLVQLPQAIRWMVPSLVSQFVVLLKDSSLGFVLSYHELLRRAEITGQFSRSLLQVLFVAAVIYVAVNATLSYLARWLERRTRAGAMVAAAGAGPRGRAGAAATSTQAESELSGVGGMGVPDRMGD
ncbi:amino acid ABC transporter permease [Frankia sp. CNm7]|uniref:Amino acid ABC transporter permease n=1 Tax=Frankia nepalensis TaxID=1836974 RepID=A0A937RFI3_9ACTN|nr:amino acid ABC transporter permease [Frankia nepalensis]MBL7497308.1 amino acid ABC transporter permease [Frankia nepalensis]MBL7511145.1 amino acid ABC transporter permease [Frankia nepalensis]MBL7519675.1 amino acid ABC transporter permease [Frankia nepalensis]MBL7631218.1 amino acid ABC transporter permease [Frankia nepalensis]